MTHTDFSAPADVDVILPCLDEAGALPWVLSRLPAGYRAVVVDNGSRDGSPEIAAALGALVLHEPQPGYGAAVHRGLTGSTAEVVAVIDCDGSLDPAELPALVHRIRSGAVDLVCGRRVPRERSVWPWHARWGTTLLAALISIGARTRLHDIAPVRVARRDDLVALDLRDRRCGYPLETLLRATDRGWRIQEVPVGYGRRAAGTRSKISGTVRGTRIAAGDFLSVLVEHRLRRRGGTALLPAPAPAPSTLSESVR